MVAGHTSAFFLTILLSSGAFIAATVITAVNAGDPSHWRSCGGDARSVGALYMRDCGYTNCTLQLNRTYDGHFQMVPKLTQNTTHLRVTSLTSGHKLLFAETIKRTLTAGRFWALGFTIRFDSTFSNERIKKQIIQVLVTGSNSTQIGVCRTFQVRLNSTSVRTG